MPERLSSLQPQEGKKTALLQTPQTDDTAAGLWYYRGQKTEPAGRWPGQQEGEMPDMDSRLQAVKIFDDFFYAGHETEGFHILRTSEGLVLFDAMADVNGDEEYLIPGLKELGLDQEKILMLFITHGHFDHYLGAEHVRRRTGCEVALSGEDCIFMVSSFDNRDKDPLVPRITRVLKDGEDFVFGDHGVHVMAAPGHTPGCLNFFFPVHHGAEEHTVLLFGGYGIFGPGRYPGGEYPLPASYAVEQALTFASACVKTWEYCREHHVDVCLNPHPHLCRLLELVKENEGRGPGEPNAVVIGLEGVRQWLADRFDACMESAEAFTDIRKPLA